MVIVFSKSKDQPGKIRLPILLVVSRTGKTYFSLSPFAPESLVSRDGFGRPVPRQPAHLNTQADSDWLLLLLMVLTHGIPPDFRGGLIISS